MASPLVQLRDAYLDASALEHDPTVRRLFAAYMDEADTPVRPADVRTRVARVVRAAKRRLGTGRR